MGPVDRWWNERFPAHSVSRLVFLMVAGAVIAVGVEGFRALTDTGSWAIGTGFSFGFLMISLIGTEAMVVGSWTLARNRKDEIDIILREDKEVSPITWDPELSPTTPSSEPSPIMWDLEAPLASRKQRPSRMQDIAICSAISFVGMMIVLLFFFEVGTPWYLDVLTAATVAIIFSISLVFRYSFLVILGISAFMGYGVAAIMHAFFMFLSDDQNIWLYWLLGTVLVASVLLPGWAAVRSRRKVLDVLRIPNWVTATFVWTFMVMCFVFVSGTTTVPEAGTARAGGFEGPNGVQRVTVPSASREHASLSLFFAWKNDDREGAQRFATANAIDNLFATPPDASARFSGCGTIYPSSPRCVIRTSEGLILLGTEMVDAGWGVTFVDRVALDHPVEYDSPNAAPTPTATPTP